MGKRGIKKKILSIMMVLAMVFSMIPSTLAVNVSAADADASKTLTVDASAAEVEGETYTNIQAAINYIYSKYSDYIETETKYEGTIGGMVYLQDSYNTKVNIYPDDMAGWTIIVNSGTYAQFSVLEGLNDLTIKAAEGADVTITTWTGTENNELTVGVLGKHNTSARKYTVAIAARNITFDGLNFTVGTYDISNISSSYWSKAAITDCLADMTGVDTTGLTVKNCSFTNLGEQGCQSTYLTGEVVNVQGILVGNESMTVEDCSFEGFGYAIAIMADSRIVSDDNVNIKNNTFTSCDYALNCYYGGNSENNGTPKGKSTGTVYFTGNTVIGTSTLRSKICIMDQYVAGSIGSIEVSDNDFQYTMVVIENIVESDCTVNDVLADNTWNDGSFYVDLDEYYWDGQYQGKLTVDIPAFTYYESPESDTGYWVLNVNLEEYDTGTNNEYVQALIDAANAEGSHTLSITFDDNGNLMATITALKDCIYWVSTETSSLTVEKDVVYGNSSKEFAFTVKIDTSELTGLEDLVLTGEYGTKYDADGNEQETVSLEYGATTFTLSDGQYVIFENLPVGATYKVTEDSTSSYTTKINSSDDEAESITGTIQEDETTISYTNTFNSTDWETSKSKEATNLDENYESNVTLSLPSAEEELAYDIVFVLDKSTSTEVEDDILDMLQTLQDQIEDTGASIKVGVVIFNKVANVTCELTDLETGYETIKDAITYTISSGTNLHAGLLAGKAMLDDDTSVDASRKYLIVVSDGITYMYGEDAQISTYYWLSDGSPYYSYDPEAWNFKYGSNAAPSNWVDWYAEVASTFVTDSSNYAYYANKNDLTTDDATNADELETYEYTTNVDRALLLSYQTYTEAQNEGYTCFAVMKDTTSEYLWGPSFMNYLAGGETVNFSDIEEEILYLLDAGSKVKDVMGYGTDSEGNEYDFDFIDEASRITLTVGGTIYSTSVSKEELDENETSRYIFTAEGVEATNGAEAPFVLHYYKNGVDGDSDECFIWDINVPVTNFEQVQLTYGVRLTNPQTDDATYGTYDKYGNDNDGSESYGLYTNNVATLYPVDTDGNEYPPEDFNKPTVSYEIVNVSVSKIWDDNEDQDAVRPDFITIELLDGVEVIATAQLSDENDWTYEFIGLRQWSNDDEGYETIKYTINEITVEGYKTTITDSTDGYVVTNSHETETTEVTVTKVWEDADDQDGIRPESVTITLYANGAATDKTATLSASNNWTYTFTGLDKYSGGVEIKYTVTENYIDEYDSVISGNAVSGYVVTNTYEPETINIEVAKTFDVSDKDGETHSAVTVVLYANGVSTGKTITLSEDNNWYGTFTDLAKYEDGEEIEYTIKERSTSGDISIVTGSDSEGFTITTYVTESTGSSGTTSSSSSTDDEVSDTSESTSKTTELTTGSEDGSVSTTSAQGETESNSVSWIVPVVGVGVAAILGVVIFEMKKRAQLSE